MKAVVAAFNQEKALVGAFSVITNLRMEFFEALMETVETKKVEAGSAGVPVCAQVDSAHLCWRDTARQHHASTEQRPPRSDFFVCHKQDSRGPAIARAAAELRGRSPSK